MFQFTRPLRLLAPALACAAIAVPVSASKSKSAAPPSLPIWRCYGGNPQHTALSTVPAQSMRAILWQTPLDLQPQYSGDELLIHYGSPLATRANTIVCNVKTGANSGFRVEGRKGADGTLIWSEDSDYILPDSSSYDWTPSYGSAITNDNRVVMPGAGGTIIVRSNADSAKAKYTRLCFYGIDLYNANKVAFNSTVKICTPLTVDDAGNIYFGFKVEGSNGANLTSGYGWVNASGNGNWVACSNLDPYSGAEPLYNCAPALSNNQSILYVVVRTPYDSSAADGQNHHSLIVALDPGSLSALGQHLIRSAPDSGGNTEEDIAHIDGTASPMIGPDGDVYIGGWTGDNGLRGYMAHYDSTLTAVKPAGAFGWDDTASLVPKSMVPGYTGKSSYLILTKYNNYAGVGTAQGDGENKVGVLDPNATQTDAYGRTVMKEVMTVLGPTPNTGLPGVREWCINTAAVDPATNSAIVNSEDGTAYRWSLKSGKLVEKVKLTSGIGEAYTSTIVGADGLCYAISNATLYAMWDTVIPSSLTPQTKSIFGGNSISVSLQLSTTAGMSGDLISLTSSNPAATVPTTVSVPYGQISATFTLNTAVVNTDTAATITATRYGHSATTTITVKANALATLAFDKTSIYAGTSSNGTVSIAAPAPAGGRVVSLTSSSAALTVPASATVAEGTTTAQFTATSHPTDVKIIANVTASSSGVQKVSSVTVKPAVLVALTGTPTTVVGGFANSRETLKFVGVPTAAGGSVAVSYGSGLSGPSTVQVGSSGSASFTVVTPKVSAQTSAVVTCTAGAVTKSLTLTLVPFQVAGFKISPSSVNNTYGAVGTITLNAKAPSTGTDIALSSPTSLITLPSTVHVNAGYTGTTFKIATKQVSASTTKSLSATLSGIKAYAAITVNPIPLSAVTLGSSSVTGGTSVAGHVTITVNAGSAPISVLLTSSNTAVATVPSSVQVLAGKNTATFTVATKAVASTQTVTITAKIGAATMSQSLTVNP